MSQTNDKFIAAPSNKLTDVSSRGDDLGEEETETPSYLTDALPDVVNDEIKAPAQQETVRIPSGLCHCHLLQILTFRFCTAECWRNTTPCDVIGSTPRSIAPIFSVYNSTAHDVAPSNHCPAFMRSDVGRLMLFITPREGHYRLTEASTSSDAACSGGAVLGA